MYLGYGATILVLFSLPISCELFRLVLFFDIAGVEEFMLAREDELPAAAEANVFVIDINAERLGTDLVTDSSGTSPDELLYRFGVVGSAAAACLEDGMRGCNTEDTDLVGALNEPLALVDCSVPMVLFERRDTSIPLSTEGDI